LKLGVLVGDPETERDAIRIREAGIDCLQIVTGGMCHIEAQMILQALDHFDYKDLDILFIENVGNLVCPAAFDLGEDYRITLIATTEGDDKPKKYPRMFLTSELMVVSKSDLLPHVPFSIDAVTKDAREINPDLDVISISSLNGEGLDQWCNWLQEKVKQIKISIRKLGKVNTYHIHLSGIVQGIGFRPMLYNYAIKNSINGLIYNSSEGLHFEFQSIYQIQVS